MKNISKRKYLLSSIICILLTVSIIGYFKFPLSSDKVIIQMNNIDKINFGYYKQETMNVYEIEFDQAEEVKQIVDIFNYTNYTRIPGYKNISNDGRYLSMIVFFGKDFNNYILEISDQGYLVVNRKTYKLTDNQTKVFNELYQILVAEHKPKY